MIAFGIAKCKCEHVKSLIGKINGVLLGDIAYQQFC